ncbi:hypothetical protein C2E23DRAFT_870795 [Lenzites betulinus]|nr:hypothetical protein C2E23DRAFT_870795 [Lenzites betulinus]
MLSNPLFDVLRAYGTLQPPKSIRKEDITFNPLHSFLLDHILLSHHFEAFPPSKQYQSSFWRWAIDWLEELVADEARHILTETFDEIDERIYTHHIDLVQELSSHNLGAIPPSASYLTYLWPSEHPPAHPVYPGHANATLLESRTIIEGGTTGLRTWSASLVLAQYLLSSELVQGKRALELGCGVGFLGIVSATIQLEDAGRTSSLWLTDVHDPVLQRCEDNLRLPCNQSHKHPDLELRTFDWFDAADPQGSSFARALFDQAQPDVILGADVVYDPSIIPPLIDTLVLALARPNRGNRRKAYIALTQRNEETLLQFVRQAEERLSVEIVTTSLAADNIFTSSAELGQSASAQVVKIFKLQSTAV